jgi:hypothetical protein
MKLNFAIEIAIEIALLCNQNTPNEFLLILQPFTEKISFSTHV